MSNLFVTIIQTNLHWEDKAANRQMLEEKIMSIKDKTEIVVLPEMFSTGFSMKPSKLAETMEGETVGWMRKMAIEKKIILTGSLIIEEAGNYFNRLIWMLPNGQHGHYDKRHLFGYAAEDNHYTAGTKRLIASVKGWKINLLVCYDLRFPVWARQQSQEEGPEYDVLIYVANWPERRSHAWKTLLQARAIENQSYVVGVNRTGTDGNDIYHSGDSMIVDPMGEVLYTKMDVEDIFTITLDKSHLHAIRERLPFLKDADGFMILKDSES
ncbi:MAG: amidohydrolase [Chitinophagaceae bacterium]|jgi:predicted amidohydrolase|nr:amidohydrolase [Chitinophagaceae bacterium]MBK7678049.1 amidohydrolase [Chitinophagaceae bacterium]MBK8301367.1 amidohydrolase [Chitinophagaceae bacterium]MBK9466113.1 amidohydrolase [Chitinophagaceae bacterium]MBK9658305.1 amidohydrolase [Chitinophagaceae bacterium]